MYAHVEKSKATKSRAVANSVVQKKNNVNNGVRFVDSRAIETDIAQFWKTRRGFEDQTECQNLAQLNICLEPANRISLEDIQDGFERQEDKVKITQGFVDNVVNDYEGLDELAYGDGYWADKETILVELIDNCSNELNPPPDHSSVKGDDATTWAGHMNQLKFLNGMDENTLTQLGASGKLQELKNGTLADEHGTIEVNFHFHRHINNLSQGFAHQYIQEENGSITPYLIDVALSRPNQNSPGANKYNWSSGGTDYTPADDKFVQVQ